MTGIPIGESAGPVASGPTAASSPRAEHKALGLRVAGLTDVGLVREHNEDCMLVADLTARARLPLEGNAPLTVGPRGLLFMVCDGMGGAAAGEVASQMSADVIYGVLSDGPEARDREDFARSLVEAIQEAGARIFLVAKCNKSQHGMGTTATVAGVHGRTLFVGQVGDSRAYILRRGRLRLMTRDQSLVFKMVDAGRLTEAEAEDHEHSNIILQALGTTDTVTVDLSYVELCPGDAVMLCSDGLSGFVSADRIRETLATVDHPAECCHQLVQDALRGGGHDNATVIVLRVEGDAPSAGPDEADGAYEPYVLLESPDPFPGMRAVTSIKAPALPPPGSAVKLAQSFPPAASSMAPDHAPPELDARGEVEADESSAPIRRAARGAAWLWLGALAAGVLAVVGWWILRGRIG